MSAAIAEKLEQALALLKDAPFMQNQSIGIGITSRNRYDNFKKSYAEIVKYSPGCKIVVVDDASSKPIPEATFRFNQNVGIARAKNKCFELLEDCEHIFLFDDDTYPLQADWYKAYVEAGQPHLMYIFKDFAVSGTQLNDTVLLYENSKLKAWSHARGCMLYFQRKCLDKVGGMNPVFGTWGWEHVNLSERIYYAGLTNFKYADIANSKGLIYSADEYKTVQSTVTGQARNDQINKNRPVYESLKGGAEFVPYKEKSNIFLTGYFANVVDPQRKEKWEVDGTQLSPLMKSLNGAKLIVLSDCLSDTEPVGTAEFIKVQTSLNPYFQRWVSFREYLLEHRSSIEKVFCVDATDVEILKDPFPHMQNGKLYTGDEHEVVNCEWMQKYHQHPALKKFISDNTGTQLLNAGLLGGSVDLVIEFVQHVLDFYFNAISDCAFNVGRPDAGHTDMGAFNYIARTKYNELLVHGTLVNTRFKANERNSISWFKHK